MFARHVPLKEHINAMFQKPNDKRPIINIYIGTPNRVRALAQAQAIDLNSKYFKTCIFDCQSNSKGFNILEALETRDDTFNLLLYSS